MTCYGYTHGGGWVQELYETASKEAGKRARKLRKLGFKVSVGSLGMQVTRVGRVAMTLLTIHNADIRPVPPPEKIEEL